MTLALLLLLVLATFHRFFPSLLVWSGATKLFSRSSLYTFVVVVVSTYTTDVLLLLLLLRIFIIFQCSNVDVA